MTYFCTKCNAEMKSAGIGGKCRSCYDTQEAEERKAFKEELARQYDVVGNPKFNLCFQLAWDYGHSSGYSEIENYFSSLVELIK